MGGPYKHITYIFSSPGAFIEMRGRDEESACEEVDDEAQAAKSEAKPELE